MKKFHKTYHENHPMLQ